MAVVEILLGAVAGAAVVATLGLVFVGGVIGALSMLGWVRFAPCERCRHVGVVAPSGRLLSCVHCRHPLVLHPVHAARDHHRATHAIPR